MTMATSSSGISTFNSCVSSGREGGLVVDGINFFEYIVDILDKTGAWQPNIPLAKYRDAYDD